MVHYLVSQSIYIFLQKNYQEIYADCYAGYCLYKLNQDINIFEHIQRFRINQKNNYKKANPSLYHEYYETYSIEFFKKELLNKPTINNYNDIHDLINKSIIKGIFKTVLEEVETNDSILKAINEFAYEFNKAKPLKGFFERLYNGAQNYNAISQQELDDVLNNTKMYRQISDNTVNFTCHASGIEFNVLNINIIRNKYHATKNNCPYKI
jgi:hypothetical protein